ncbi:Dyp-type peroxidase [Pseudonocardia acaciae]|uniref:Dyp-type peroxidase n=1 Tax=Pseudonocardia acaciae TaxID=551276 RepID=UPI00048E6293|nr:Dyp-type peroxidase [Pseudonocardia acaciae]
MARRERTQDVLAPPARAAIFMVVTVRAGAEAEVNDLLADVAGLTRAVGFRVPEEGLSCVVGVGARLWDRLYGSPRPAGLHPFRPLAGAVHTAVSTPGDLLFHLRAGRLDLCFELAGQLMARLEGLADVVDEVHGFRYFDERDLLGFVDGTENPTGDEASAAVTIGDEDPDFAGGSYVIVQKYLHDLDAWNALPVEEQERAIGRRKLNDIELPDAVKPTNSHVALTTIEDPDGTERQIVRDNMAFGAVGAREFGTYFIGYAATPDVIEQMLTNMFIGDPPGNHDRILDFSTAVTGGLFFVPTADFLEDPPPPRTEAEDGSLGIGGLSSKEHSP